MSSAADNTTGPVSQDVPTFKQFHRTAMDEYPQSQRLYWTELGYVNLTDAQLDAYWKVTKETNESDYREKRKAILTAAWESQNPTGDSTKLPDSKGSDQDESHAESQQRMGWARAN